MEENSPDLAEVAPPLVSKEPIENNVVQFDTKTKRTPANTRAPVATKQAPKKVITGESRKEQQKLLKQRKDERRLMIDARHTFLFQTIADASDIDMPQVEDALLGDEKWAAFDDFFAPNQSRKIMFYYQDVVVEDYSRTDSMSIGPVNPQKKLFIANGSSEPLKGLCFLFIRSTDKAITVNNIAADITFQMLDASGGRLLDALERHISKIIIPILQNLEDWGTMSTKDGHNSKIAEFFEILDRFLNALTTAQKNMDSQMQLDNDDDEDLMAKIETPSYRLIAVNSSETMEKLENLLKRWIKQIEQVLSESEQIRREADDVGPSAELSYWKSRMSRFNNLLEQMKTKRVTDVIAILHFAKSRSLRKWRELDARITDAANEAKDNVKYLYTLDKFFGPLSKCNPVEMIEHIQSLINAIRMIYSISQYYNSSERMTSLFVKVTNQMITTCKHYMYDGVSKIWEHSKEELTKRINNCVRLNEEYEMCFHATKTKLQEDPVEKQFEFSENYIFGKFDAFCKRLGKIKKLLNILESYSILQTFKIEGIDSIVVRYKSINDTIKKKTYDILDHRKSEFDNDYQDFIIQFENLEIQIHAFLDAWFQKTMPIDKQINLLKKFEKIDCLKLDCQDKHSKILHNYAKTMDIVKKLYQKNKNDPPLMRNLPPISGKISWSRHLFKKIEGPMILFKESRPDILKSPEAIKLVKNYNKIAKVLLEFELIYYNNWYKTVENFKVGLGSSLLIRNPNKEKESEKFLVNFDPMIFELIQEAKYIKSLNLEIPEMASRLIFNENIIKDTFRGLQELLMDYAKIIESVPLVVYIMMKPHIHKLDEAFIPGMVSLTWTSMKIPEYMIEVQDTLNDFRLLIKNITDIFEVRIETILNDMANTSLCAIPEDEAITINEFLTLTEQTVHEASDYLAKQSNLVETAVNDVIEILKISLTEVQKRNLSNEEGYECLHPDPKKPRCSECQPCIYYAMLNNFTQRNTEALIKSTRLTLDTIKKRLQSTTTTFTIDLFKEDKRPALFRSDLVLHIPNILTKPNLDEIQQILNKAVQVILKMSENIEQWTHMNLHQKQIQEQEKSDDTNEDSKVQGQGSVKSLNKIIADHKDVAKTVNQLSVIMNTFKSQIQELLSEFSGYSTLWKEEPQVKVKEFMQSKPILSEIHSQIKYFADMEIEIHALPATYKVGAVILYTETLKQGLIAECHSWKNAYAQELNNQCAQEMDAILELFDSINKRFARPVKDLDDVRSHMGALTELREAEIKIEMTIQPIEEAYVMLHKYEIYFNDGNSERVDSLSYGYSKLRSQAQIVQDHLLEIQPHFKGDLIDGVRVFKEQVITFVDDYDTKGPMVMGIAPSEASDRLTIYQTRFDELSRKFTTYSGGEELFGLEVTDYPDLQRIRKELNLLQKLYQLYNSVLDTVNSYYDIAWSDINIDTINQQLLDFQNKCRKLPKALKEWQAYDDLRKTIDDFNETCPLLEQMSNNSMMSRHWERIETVTGHKFDIESDNFLLRNLMEAPLLVNKEEIEDICISAVKEKDIEAKLKVVINDWSSQSFSFSLFKSRGELLLKGDSTGEVVSLMEDSLMVLGALMSNRYNAPFKVKIQEWVQKLTGTTEIIENWLLVQNLWIYLEAVFVGGDIAKQLPQEAKRFGNIDKSWQKIMQRAHEIPNVVQCSMGDDTLSQLLPHLLEQLELCQKSLTGYLEKKRLVFPRFFFVSDPALLEILGQASDSHTIQAHLLSVFDNTKTVTFDEKNYDKIMAINSQENETVPLDESVLAQGNVEIWLGDLLKMSQKSLHSVIRSASITMNDSQFKLMEFENSFPSQVGLLGIQMIWTRDSEEALTQSKVEKKIMQQTNQKFLDILNELISITTQNLTKIERTKFETLITIHVHQRDIFDDLVTLKINTPKDFEWLKQSRFYFIEDTDQCIVSITDVNFSYQNEFLGCTDRLVITPLTDRCYITLSQALGMSLGGAPAGPAGTGKTETTKDMGRCLGKFVVVFNCSDQMDYRGLGRIYKGLAQSGSWGCFDEFNRIELPVLSVAAQQISVVLTCKKERKPQFIFTDGDTVDMDPEFGIFLTMNPGYAGRQELPENLKINFRTVAMMVPDRAIIMRVKLASCGFLQNTILSKKFYTLYKLCEEQLSKQVHYDFGLRNILSVLRTLGAFKREHPDDSEPLIVMRVLRDMNLSKLVDEDEALFLSLIEDLFPEMKVATATYPEIGAAIDKQIELAKLIDHDPWRLKLIQLFETQRVRHGMMTLGPSGAGKTKCINILMRAMTDCGEPHKEMRMNPKAITAPQMFGRLDVATNDWTDGIFSTLWRRTHKVKKGEHVWLVLDGPVDAIWIENLNSVLDDNKTLTLANGDRIPMAPNTKIIFEVHNIDNASPATVSRNGMVYMSSSILDWKPILKSWLIILETTESISNTILNTFILIFSDAYRYVSQSLIPKMITLECNYIRQAVDLLQGLIQGIDIKEIGTNHLERLIMFSIMWSLGALLELEDRLKLQEFMVSKKNLPLPQCNNDDTIFEYVVNGNGEWEHWTSRVPEYIYPTDHVPEYISILVPNVDNTRTDFLINTIAKQNKAVLLIGEQGTAKTVIVKGYCGKYNPEDQIFKSLNFSSATTPNMFQRTIESYVDKRMGTTFGPPGGRKMTVFIDDINMPIINEWGDQITNEIVRQMMEMSGVYNLEKPGDFTTIIDIQMIAAMIHPGGGRNDIPQRLKRHFSIFNCTLPSNASIDKIFRVLGCGYFCDERGYKPDVRQTVDRLVAATRKLWQKTKVKMLPTPSKFHYVFNLRDLSRIWQGMLIVNSEVINSGSKVMSLWKHECMRVITDRFTEQSDKDWFEKALKVTGEEECGADIIAGMENEPYFVDFLRDAPEATGDENEEAELEAPKIYEPIESYEQLSERLIQYMTSYNETVRGGKLDLVFFKDAMTHLVKISRVIRTTKGHALLVGVGGSGKQSLTRLASFIAGCETFQITLTRSYNISNLMEDLKLLYRSSGQHGKGMTFLFTDNEIKDESFLEFLNNMLSSGEIANLFARDEMDEILQELVVVMKKEHPRRPPSNENLQEYYISRVLRNLHVVLCFSPVGEKFRNRSLRFPGLISGCTIDWFQRWPKDALIAVSNYFLSMFEIVCTPEVKKAVVNTMGVFQDLVAENCLSYFQRYRRLTHVTPKSYLSFISGYKEIYLKKKEEIGNLATRMNTGLKKLVEATGSVAELSIQLEVKEKELAVASKKAGEVLAQVEVKASAAQKVKEQVQVVKDRAEALVNNITRDKAIAEEKLEAAKPALQEAEEALETIKPQHIATVKKLGRPPHLIMRIMDCVLILFKRRLDPVTPDPERPCAKPTWDEAVKLMSGSNFLVSLLNFPKDSINDEVVDLMEPYFNMEDFNLQSAKNVSGDVAGLCSWTKAMASFFSINKEVLPLKANLTVQQSKLEFAMKELNNAQDILDAKQKELDIVQAEYNQAMDEKQALIDDAEACRRKMTNAKALIGGLAGERERWTEASKTFDKQIKQLVGDVLLVTAFLSYCGPFNQDFRNLLQRNWKNELITNGIPFTDDMSAINMLTDNATISEWNIQGLPNDELSTQNGLIVTRAPRFPLLIDPQGQGKAWIKNKEKNNELQVTALNHKYFRNHLEDSLSLGRPLLIEDVNEDIDPALDNVLEKNFIKSGRTLKVKVGDKEVDVMNGFQLYVTTKLPNPSYTPEIFAKTSIIDFTVTIKGLEDQLLGIVILTEKQELEAERTKLMEEVSENKRKTKELEDNLLYRLTSTEGSLVEDESLIEVLRVTKETAEDVQQKLIIGKDTEIKINSAREEYRPVATRGSILYFLIVEMSMVNDMYQTSLKQFLGLFDKSMALSQKSPITTKRINNIIEYLTYEVFRYTARGFYENDKFTFTILLTMKIAMKSGQIRHEEFQVFIKGGAALDLNTVEPKPKKWIQDLTWLNLVELSKLPYFAQITEQVAKNDKGWKAWFDADAPEEAHIPDGHDALDTFKKLLLLRSWCPDRTVPMAKKYISETMGIKFAEGIITNLEEMQDEGDENTPMICFLSMGSDPTDNIERLAKKKNLKCGSISMGQGQEIHARKLLSISMQEGRWMLLQNCHLGLNFMDEFLEILTTTENIHETFRCWVTTEGHPKFPINLLQLGIKFTYDPPLGIRAGLRRTYALLSQDQIDITNAYQWKPMLYCVAFLHTTVQERRKFGPIGWNIPYEFNQSDFTATVQFIQNHLDDMDIKRGVSWKTVCYMIGEVQYGGRVTDDYDKRLLNTYARQWFSVEMFNPKFNFYKNYPIPTGKTLDDFKAFIEKLPLIDSPECFGLHANADIIYETSNANQMLTTIVNIQPKDSGGGAGETRENVVYRLANDMLERLPEDYNPFEVKEKLQKMGTLKPLNIFLKQEVDRMQKVLSIVRITLIDLKLAIDGTIIMSENLKDALDNIFDARIPRFWMKLSWESATLGFWFTDLLDRNEQFHTWLYDGRPVCFWMTGFFNPQGFLTAMRQEITRNHKGWALDAVVLSNDVTKSMKEELNNPPNEGVYVHGLYLDGAGWEVRNARLREPHPKVLYTPLPVVHVFAVSITNVAVEKGKGNERLYECPVYKKPRRTDLNYIFPLSLRTSENPDHWILRGVALLCDIK